MFIKISLRVLKLLRGGTIMLTKMISFKNDKEKNLFKPDSSGYFKNEEVSSIIISALEQAIANEQLAKTKHKSH